MLRVVPEVAIPAVVSPEGPTRAQVRSRSIAEAALFEQAAALGFACLPIDKIEKEIAAAMVTRMRTRSRGLGDVYKRQPEARARCPDDSDLRHRHLSRRTPCRRSGREVLSLIHI